MKAQFSTASIVVLTLCFPSQSAPLFDMDDVWGREKIAMPSGRKSLSEMLKAYSKAARAGVFADVSEDKNTLIGSPEDFVAPPTEVFPQSRRMDIGFIAFESHMSFDRSSLDAWILWPQTDPQYIARLIVAEQQRFDAATPKGEREATIAAIKNFYAQHKGWNPDPKTPEEKATSAQGVPGTLALSDFPSTLQAPLLAELVFELRTLSNTYEPAAWTDDYWKEARVRLHTPIRQRDGKLAPNPYLVPVVDVQFAPDRLGNMRVFPVGQPQQVKVAWEKQGHRPSRFAANVASRLSLCAPEGDVPPSTAFVLPGFTFEPSQEGTLQKTVTLSHQSAALPVIVTDLSTQVGVTLQVAPDVAVGTKTTAISEGMTLASAMSALARLYCGHWQKEGQGYSLQSDYLDELHTLMVQAGNSAFYKFVTLMPEEDAQMSEDLAGQVVDACDEEQLRSKEGVLFSSLPAELQQGIRTFMSAKNVGGLVVGQQRVDDALASGIRIRFAPRPDKAPQLFGAFGTPRGEDYGTGDNSILSAYASDGRYITRLFPEFIAEKMSRSEAIRAYIEQRQREQEAKMNQLPPDGAPQQ